jgi:hypothetical protein
MVPLGAVHLPGMPGAGRIASQLGFDWARAVVGFERKAGMMIPRTDGIVVPAVAEDVVCEAWEQHEAIKAAENAKKKTKRSLKNWAMMCQGVLALVYIRERRTAANTTGPTAPHIICDSIESDGDATTNTGTVATTAPTRKLRKRARLHRQSEAAGGVTSSQPASKVSRRNVGLILDSSSSAGSASSRQPEAKHDGSSSGDFADSAVFSTSGDSAPSSSADELEDATVPAVTGSGQLTGHAGAVVEYDEL